MQTKEWTDICFPVQPVWLADLLPDYDIMATDRQQLVVGQSPGGRKTVYGIQSADYTIIPNETIREVVEELITDYDLQINHTTTGEFGICIILPQEATIGPEKLQRSLILTNSYHGKTPFSIQGQTFTSLLDDTPRNLNSSLHRGICQNALLGWADPFTDIQAYQRWLTTLPASGTKRSATGKSKTSKGSGRSETAQAVRKIHHSRITLDVFREHLRQFLLEHLTIRHTLTHRVYEHWQQTGLSAPELELLRSLPIPVQLAKQARERLWLEERQLQTRASYWLLYNAVNYALFTARSSLTLNDRYRLDERVFHQLAATVYA